MEREAKNETWFTMRVQELSREWAAGNLGLGEFENCVVMAARDRTRERTGNDSLEQPTIMLGVSSSSTTVEQSSIASVDASNGPVCCVFCNNEANRLYGPAKIPKCQAHHDTALPTIMTMAANPIVDQPAPVESSHRHSWLLVMDLVRKMSWGDENDSMVGVIGQDKRTRDLLLIDMEERHVTGIHRYGVALQAGNGRRHLVDAYQELLDFIVYIMTWAEENGVDLHTMRNFGDLPQPEKTGARIMVSVIHESIYKAAVIRELIEKGC